MPQKWTGDIVGKMHINRITYEELANKLGVTKAYISMILNGARNPEGAQERFETALNELVSERTT